MTGFLFTGPKFQGFDNNGYQLSGGKLYSYIAGTTTPTPTYPTKADADAGTNANANPIILDSRGEAPVYPVITTKFVLTTADDVVIWTVDNVPSTTGAAGPAGPAGATDPAAILGDGTADTTLRVMSLYISKGTDAGTIKCQIHYVYNNKTVALEDNLAKAGETANFALESFGQILTIKDSAIDNWIITVLSISNDLSYTSTRIYTVVYDILNSTLRLAFYDSLGNSIDVTTINSGFYVRILYLTSVN